MTYICSKKLLNKYDNYGKILGKLSEKELIKIINNEFGLKGTVTKLLLV